MANANATLSRGKSKPEKIAQFLFKHTSNWRLLLAFLLVVSLTAISITFNVMLGNLSGSDDMSKTILPIGYALLDLSALFLSGYIGLRSISIFRKLAAFLWFGVLLCLSLWAAGSFTLAIDAQNKSASLEHSIEQKQLEVESLNGEVELWRSNVANTVDYRSRYQKTLDDIRSRQLMASDELHSMEANLPQPTMAIYNMTAPLLGVTPDILQTIVRLLWAGSLTLSPLVIMLLITAEKTTTPATKDKPAPIPPKAKKRRWWAGLNDSIASKFSRKKHPTLQPVSERKTTPETNPTLTENRASQPTTAALEVPPVRGHNGATPVQHLNGLKYCIEWLKLQPVGRVTRAKLGLVSKIKNREGVTKIINALIDQGRLIRLNNGQLSKPAHHLRVIK